jgi:Flp pilus assembly pilin Flp
MVNFARNLLIRIHRDESGQGLVEYALIMGLVVFAAVSTMSALASQVNLAFSSITSKLASALAPAT